MYLISQYSLLIFDCIGVFDSIILLVVCLMINQICSHIVLQEIFVLVLIIITKKKKIKTKQNQQKYIIQNKEISYVSCVEKNNKNHKPNTE